VVDDRIRPALESGAAVGSSKPVLVIIDEIDGATGAGDNVRLVGHSGVTSCVLMGVESRQVLSRSSSL
jgi:hypothetical protein